MVAKVMLLRAFADTKRAIDDVDHARAKGNREVDYPTGRMAELVTDLTFEQVAEDDAEIGED